MSFQHFPGGTHVSTDLMSSGSGKYFTELHTRGLEVKRYVVRVFPNDGTAHDVAFSLR